MYPIERRTAPRRPFPLPAVLILFCLFSCAGCHSGPDEVVLRPGMVIDRSIKVKAADYSLTAGDSLDRPVITVRGEDIVVDFGGATLRGAPTGTLPDRFRGLAVKVEGGRNITLKHLKVHGYKVAILADGVDSLRILDADLSYNYRQRLYSRRDRENLADWLSYHHNEEDEWLRYGAGIYLRNCTRPEISGVRITNGQNGILLTGTRDGLLFNNNLRFNSGVGIGLYRSTGNRIMHNRLDYNVRGYSHGVYQRGQDSAGILCYEQSSDNVFAFNSATHSGDGFFLWAGQHTMDSGQGGSNDNLLFGNDFSYAPTNGMELTFSRNTVVGNRAVGCTYGIWAGYSFESLFLDNDLADNPTGLAIEHGHGHTIAYNRFVGNDQAIRLWERPRQPEGWGFAAARDVSSRDYAIHHNLFRDVEVALAISRTERVQVSDNRFARTGKRWSGEGPQPTFTNNATLDAPDRDRPAPPDSLLRAYRPRPLAGGQATALPEDWPAGRRSILIGPWGPYDYGYPSAWLRGRSADTLVFLLEGPAGNWKLSGGEGFLGVNPKTGTFPATVTARVDPGALVREIRWTFIGEAAVGPLGDSLRRGEEVPFSFRSAEVLPRWSVSAYDLPPSSESPALAGALPEDWLARPVASWSTDTLAYVWWEAPKGTRGQRYLTVASASEAFAPGRYRLLLTSDEGARVFVDGHLALADWQPHEPRVRTADLDLDGKHDIRVEHYNTGGLGNLDLQIHRLPGAAAGPQ